MTTTPPETWRLFFAIPMPAHFDRVLIDLQTGFQGDWRPVKPSQFHVTLLFLGAVPVTALPLLEEAGARTAALIRPFPAQLGETGAFPSLQRPRVGIVHVNSPGMYELSGHLRSFLQGRVPFDLKPFHAHLTLVRSKGCHTTVPREKPAREWEVTNFHLIRSILDRAGPTYQIHRSFVLGTG